jgi:hypothetical protein
MHANIRKICLINLSNKAKKMKTLIKNDLGQLKYEHLKISN